MGGPYQGGPSMNGSGYQQRYDSASEPSSTYDSRNAITAMNSRNTPTNNYAPQQMDPSSYVSTRSDPSHAMQSGRQQNAAGYQLADPQQRVLPPPPQTYGGPPPMNRPSEEKQRALANGGQRRPSGSRICGKCGEPLQGQFVRALDNTFHLDCFTCHECGKVVASKFFPVPDEGPDQYPLCETDYFRRLDLLCFACGGALRGSYITALDRKYHIEHFTCSVCPTIFGAQDSYYEHEGDVYCHYHYSTRFAQRCHGCQNAILKQFVEIFRNGQNQHWHPECYMIHKYWNVRLSNANKDRMTELEHPKSEDNPQDVFRNKVREEEERVEEKVLWIWRTLSTFEERSATCISDMLLHVSNGVYFDGIMAAKRFIVHVDVFFKCGDDLDRMLVKQTGKGLSYSREAKLLCKKVVSFFSLLSESSDAGVRRLGVTQELLSLVTGLAHYLKLLIRICLQGALKLERETGSGDGLSRFLNQINSLDERIAQNESLDPIAESLPYVRGESDHCPVCTKPVEDKCAKLVDRCVHLACMRCKTCGRDLNENLQEAFFSPSTSNILCYDHRMQYADGRQGFVFVTRLQQYVHLLLVAHARLLATLRSQGALPHTSDDPNLARYDSSQGHRPGRTDELSPPMLSADQRSKSFAGSTPASAAEQQRNNRASASYEQTLGDIRRLRSTRMERHLSTTQKHARTSTVIEGPGGGVRAGPEDNAPRNKRETMQQGDESLAFGAQSIALDDIPRLVAAEQAREQRPNASKYARGALVREQQPRLLNGHRRDMSGGNELDRVLGEGGSRSRRYFSELSPLEYFFVRHIAVLNMEPLLDGHFNQQELLNLIEAPEKSNTTFWARFGKALSGGKKNEKQKKGVFGKPLDQIVERDGAESTDGVGPGALRIPALIDCAVASMRNMDMSVEGVFRKNGNIRRLRELSEEIDLKGCESVDLTKETPVQVAALLKKFLRELSDPVMSTKLHRLWITAARIPDEEKQRRVLHLTCCLLPKVNRDTMEILFNFMNWVASFHTVDEETGSKMDIHNLATVIAPNILYSDIKSPDMDSSFLAIEAVTSMIECNEMFSEIPEDITSLLNDPIFEKEADVTTKEILKRYGDVSKASKVNISQGHGNGSREGRGAIQHVSDDNSGWPMESSVRHVAAGGPGGGNNNNNNNSAMSTPPPHFTSIQQQDNGSPNRQSQFRSSGVPRQGPLGITGAG